MRQSQLIKREMLQYLKQDKNRHCINLAIKRLYEEGGVKLFHRRSAANYSILKGKQGKLYLISRKLLNSGSFHRVKCALEIKPNGSDFEIGDFVFLKICKITSQNDHIRDFVQNEKEILKQVGLYQDTQTRNSISTKNFGYFYDKEYIFETLIDGMDVMDYFEMKSALRDIDVEEMISLLYKMAVELERAHGTGLLHLDVKPENFMLEEKTKDCYLVDYGFSQYLQDGQEEVVLKRRVGTPGYVAPEIAEAFEASESSYSSDMPTLIVYNKACDVYSFGRMIEIFLSSLIVEPNVYGEILSLYRACCKKDPAERPDMSSVVAQLKSLLKCVPESPTNHSELSPDPLVNQKQKEPSALSLDIVQQLESLELAFTKTIGQGACSCSEHSTTLSPHFVAQQNKLNPSLTDLIEATHVVGAQVPPQNKKFFYSEESY